MAHEPRPRGAIATSHHIATEAGAAELAAGGNAIDAALAAAATLCVVYPNNVALGGDLVALVRSPAGEIRFLNATGTAPAGQSLEALRARHGEKLPPRGIDTITVPGGIRGWEALHEAGASRSWEQHLETAVRLAEEGYPNSRSVARALIDQRETLEKDPGARELFYPEGRALIEGDLVRQPALADSLRRLSAGGAEEFYTGQLAEKWVAGLARLGSRITPDDTKAYRVNWGEPLEVEFSGYRVLTSPPNTSGFILLRALNAISTGIVDPLGTGAGGLAAVLSAANAVRAAALADPDFGGASGAELIGMAPPKGAAETQPHADGDTVGLCAVSSDGWAISLINSIYTSFGSQILEPDTGIIFQSRGTAFSLDPSSPNVFAPRKRPRHTLMPVLVLRGDELAWVPATMGGSGQPQIHAQLLLRSLAGAAPDEATGAPRWIVGEAVDDGTVAVMAEENLPESALESLADAGFTVNMVPPHTERLGHSNLIRVDESGYAAASDPRSDGSAIVVSA